MTQAIFHTMAHVMMYMIIRRLATTTKEDDPH